MKNTNKRDVIKRIAAIVCAIFVALAIFASIIPAAFAATEKEIEDAKAKTQQAKDAVEENKKKVEEVLAQFNAVDKQISDTEYQITTVKAQIEQTEKDIKTKQEELKKAEQDYIDYQELFKVRARAMYENTEMDYLEILFGAENFGDFLSKIEIITQLMNYDQSVLEKLENIKKQIKETKKELETNLVSQKESKAVLENTKASLQSTLAEKQELLDKIQADGKLLEAAHEAAEAAENAVINQNQAALSFEAYPVDYSGTGMVWPVPSTKGISSYYGYRIHPIYGYRKFHAGIDINASYGVDIIAAESGTVTMATYNGGYGKCVIINHGSGITTLYGHNSELNVTSGQKVVKGQVIAKAGSTGLSTGPHLHFEVRINGSTRNPLDYVK